mmetsp:Transcript_4499/g.11569  ORF Transcript_4499/g.11569 Transcript_4499/m.11569 type:complete len:245 (-) Transcript_4499:29-763(-)
MCVCARQRAIRGTGGEDRRCHERPAREEVRRRRCCLGDEEELAGVELLGEGQTGLAFLEHGPGHGEHGEAAVGHLGVEFLDLLLALVLGAEEAAAVVARVVGRRPPGELDETHKGEDLGEARRRDGEDALEAVGDVAKLDLLRHGQVPRELHVGVVEDEPGDGHHADAAVLAFHGAAPDEGLGAVLGQEPQGIVEPRRRLDPDLHLVDGLDGHRRLGRRGGHEGRGRRQAQKDDDLEHLVGSRG